MDTQAHAKKHDRGIDVAAIAGSLVHEIKNPLSTLNINAQLLLEDWKDAEGVRPQRTVRRLKVMVAEIERLERILQSFLRFTERHELRLAPASLNAILEEVVEFMTPKISQQGAQARLWLEPGLQPIHVDADLIRQVFLNLILNALAAMEGGGEIIVKSRRLERRGHLWAVGEVIDTGRGIPAHLREKIFQLYFSTKKEGSGLGLATCRRIAEEHGGFIEVESEEGKGSQFSVFLPMEASRP